MKPERLESLLWDFRDGAISAAELADLEDHLEQHPEARGLQREIEILAEKLDGMGRAVPPHELRPRIAEALADVPSPTKGAQPAVSSALPQVARWRPPTWLPIAASLLIGVTIGFLLQPGTSGSINTSRATGTMSTISTGSASQTLEVDLGGASGSVKVSRKGGLATIDVDLAIDADLEIEMEVADGFLLFTGVEPIDTADLEVNSTVGKTVFRTRGPSTHSLEITATMASAPIRLIIRANGSVVTDDWLAEGADGHQG